MGDVGSFFEDLGENAVKVGTGTMNVGLGLGSTALSALNYPASQAAKAQGKIAEAQLAQEQADRAQAMKYAEATPEELAQLQRAIATNESDIARKEKILASTDPAIIEAGKQALQLLRGEEAKTIAPLRSQFQKQESELRNKLAAQLGPGYENSTAGIQALTALKEAQANSLATAQEGSLAKLLGVAQNFSYSGYGNAPVVAGTLGQVFGDIQKRKISAVQGTPINSAGAQFVNELGQARALQGTLGNVFQIGGIISGMGGLGGAAPTEAAPQLGGGKMTQAPINWS